jgi:hypothetical protein
MDAKLKYLLFAQQIISDIWQAYVRICLASLHHIPSHKQKNSILTADKWISLSAPKLFSLCKVAVDNIISLTDVVCFPKATFSEKW